MFKFSFLTIKAAVVTHSEAMNADTISKNRRSSNSQTNRGNFVRKACFALLVACVTFSGCDKEVEIPKEEPYLFSDGTTLTAQVYKGSKYNSKISTVKALTEDITTRVSGDITTRATDDHKTVVATANWSDGGFTLTFPATLDASVTRPWRDEFYFTYGVGWLQGTEDARVCIVSTIYAYDASGNIYDELILYNPKTDDMRWPLFIYVSMDLSFKVIETGYTVNYKKGWNQFFMEDTYLETRPILADMWWYLMRDTDSEWLVAD